MRKNLLAVSGLMIVLIIGISCSRTTDQFERAKTPMESIKGYYNWVKYKATKNGEVILNHTEGYANISELLNGAEFFFQTHQYDDKDFVQVPEVGMIFSLFNEEAIELTGKPYDVRFDATVLSTITFYTEVPQVGQTRKIENVPVSFNGLLKENLVLQFFKDFSTEINISFEVEGDRYKFYITQMATSRGSRE